MPTITANNSKSLTLPAGGVINTSGECIAVLPLGPGANQPLCLKGNSSIGPFSTARVVLLTALTALTFSYAFSASAMSVVAPSQLDPVGMDVTGDSRAADVLLGSGWNSRSWLIQARARYGQSFHLYGLYGASGKRSDEYLTNGNFELAMASPSRFWVVSYPFVNDISQALAGYTDAFGNVVTISNVAQVVTNSLLAHAQKMAAAGKRVILLTEPGSTTFVASQVAAVHEANRILKSEVRNAQGIYLYDPTKIIWNNTGSTTLIVKKTGYSGDGTHAQQMEGIAVGTDFVTSFLPSLLPRSDTAPDSLSDTIANGTNQIFRNPLFNVTTGGTTGTNITLTSGTVPANCQISGSASMGLSVIISAAANANGYGNDITFQVTATTAGDFRFDMPANLADWLITDQFEGRLGLDIASGSTALGVYPALEVSTDSGTKSVSYWDLYAGASGPMSTAADPGIQTRTRRGGVVDGSLAKAQVNQRVRATFGASGGTVTFTLRQPSIFRFA